MSSSRYTGGILAVVLLGGIVALVCIGELPRLLFHETPESPPSTSASPAPPAVAPLAPPLAAPPPELALRARFNAGLPQAGLPAAARIIEARTSGDRLTLIFDGGLRGALGNLSALDEWIAALSRQAEAVGYHHLELRIRIDDAQGRARDVTLDSLVATPESQRPRPEPIDDGVRR